ncbi:SAG-related sequence SRS14A [Toxoplasma gondii TgCatPRC2]|uniref:SAG-related sequence SRS14A n=9 Tax=Toxoplasma gondii TaxID=5811 RepID=S7ULX1_TOXGG|nr:SAG-related sequence SRS14A [Toxoplasma gondii ME49]EPR59041.1 SAG-related sequence SRS14A [Toxoplasma gondii GT1]KAF4645327.1 SAG-related sequence SRS14A [Toxoplasma gondii]KFG52994.1 SAG-related sequence SRS14A [Toxoplasma gondii FOU]KFG60011.1 SAG-related sequence SRS14A [Toxoplasma gondii RUB]KFH15004.1 SAG-related sequence SRS14A [Toxoplasma gondii MAS]KYF41931.1 SAG-related sequence SRS14A [Toxoplasma gondii ARI]KYK67405.1 SAG-related sequence SRS14A [Toxoplasma gondii TgCatPRC2]PU|eukprot:XP_018638154.1 SAG-related sequence SRS14A [Toxoplasma gondii ME49]
MQVSNCRSHRRFERVFQRPENELKRQASRVKRASLRFLCLPLSILLIAALLQPQGSAGADSATDHPTCSAADKPVIVSITEPRATETDENGYVTFRCGEGASLIPTKNADGAFTEFCKDSECARTASLSNNKLTLQEDSEAKTDAQLSTAKGPLYKLSASKLPDKPFTAFFICETNAKAAPPSRAPTGSRCKVQVSIYGKEKLVLDSKVMCNGKDVEQVSLRIDKAPAETDFLCGKGGVLSPNILDQVFQLVDGQTKEVSLHSLVSGAVLAERRSSIAGDSEVLPAYTLFVSKLPEDKPKQLMYTCSSKQETQPERETLAVHEPPKAQTKPCNVVIEIAHNADPEESSGEPRKYLASAVTLFFFTFALLATSASLV